MAKEKQKNSVVAPQEAINDITKNAPTEENTEVTENVSLNEIKTENEVVTNTEETVTGTEVLEEEREEIPVVTSETENEENAEARTVNTEEIKEALTVKEIFKDKYDSTVIYNIGDKLIKSQLVNDNKPKKKETGKYEISEARYEELKRSLYVD